MEGSDVFKVLVLRDEAAIQKYARSIRAFLESLYGERLKTLYPKIGGGRGGVLAYLMVLNREEAMRAHLLEAEGDLAPKHRAFFPRLAELTETFLDHLITQDEYIEQCAQAWALS